VSTDPDEDEARSRRPARFAARSSRIPVASGGTSQRLDASRLECARTDLETLAEHRRRNDTGLPSWADFSRGF
jgi:hypothetical protein